MGDGKNSSGHPNTLEIWNFCMCLLTNGRVRAKATSVQQFLSVIRSMFQASDFLYHNQTVEEYKKTSVLALIVLHHVQSNGHLQEKKRP